MKQPFSIRFFLISIAFCAVLPVIASAATDAQVHVVFLQDPPVTQIEDKNQDRQQHKNRLAQQHRAVWQSVFGNKAAVSFRHEYFYASNGFAATLTPGQAHALRAHPEVRSVMPRTYSRLLTDAGPRWIGADNVWNGQVYAGASRGEGVIIGVIDSGIKPDHPSFAEEASDGYRHSNPYGEFKGLCATGQAVCNGKLVGIYDFTDEGTLGVDSNGHGTHVASTAAGNPLVRDYQGFTYAVSGVAPRAHIISYKACVKDNPNTPEENDDVCFSDDLLAAIDRAVADGVDIINYSIGGSVPCSPWNNPGLPYCGQYGSDGEAQAMLNARLAGVLSVVAAGNDGPGEATVNYPGIAPWVLTVGNLTHDRRVASKLQNFSGGDITMPEFLEGVSLTEGIGPRRIVHARDYGNALCGTGEPELKTGCNPGDPDALTGSSNPFAPGTFDGEIVVCDRGSYGRVEKGFNVKQAGAGGYVLANTSGQAESIVADAHCLPATHVGNQAGNLLRNWLASGSNHQAQIQGQTLEYNDANGDIMNASSSRGPVEIVYATASAAAETRHPVNYMKPDIAAPGTSILAASAFDNGLRSLTGTSMATPHVAGAAALIKSAHPDFGPSELISALMLSAQSGTVRKEDKATPAQAHDRGAGRARVDTAIDVPLMLLETQDGFNNGNPQNGGQPESMNLPVLYSRNCDGSCQFIRRFTNRSDRSLTFQASIEKDNGLGITVDPAGFTLAPGQTQVVTITVDTSAGDVLGRWSEAVVAFEPSDETFKTARLPVSVYASAGDFPRMIRYASAKAADRFTIDLENLAPMTRASFAGWGPVRPDEFSQTVSPDDTASDAFDGNGTVFQIFPLNTDKKLFMAHAQSPGGVSLVELYVGRDADIDDTPDAEEVLCQVVGASPIKACAIHNPTPGNYWVMVRHRGAGNKEIGAAAAFLGPDDGPQRPNIGSGVYSDSIDPPRYGRAMHVMGPAAFAGGQGQLLVTYRLPVASKAINDSERYFAAVAVGGDENSVGETALIPVFLQQTGSLEYKPFSLNNEIAEVTIPGTSPRRLIGFIDAGPGASTLDISVAFLESLQINLYRRDFDFDPLQLLPDLSGQAPTMTSGPMTQIIDTADAYAIHRQTFDISDYAPGRWYVEITLDDTPSGDGTSGAQEYYAMIQGTVGYDSQNTIQPRQSLWYNPQRDGWGADIVFAGDYQAVTWYSYDGDNQPTWYQGVAPLTTDSNTWFSPVRHYTWDGTKARGQVIGSVSITYLDERQGIITFTFDDKTHSEPAMALLPASAPCPVLNGQVMDLTGHWYAPDEPGYGSTVFVKSEREDRLFYFYDDKGLPRWVIGNSDVPDSLSGRVITMRQVSNGFCPDCQATPIQFVTIGTVTSGYDSNNDGHLAADLELAPPLSGRWNSNSPAQKLSKDFQCQN